MSRPVSRAIPTTLFNIVILLFTVLDTELGVRRDESLLARHRVLLCASWGVVWSGSLLLSIIPAIARYLVFVFSFSAVLLQSIVDCWHHRNQCMFWT